MTETATHLCLTCKLADWHRTANGRLHPDGQGKCAWKPAHIPTPAAWHWGHHYRCSFLRQPVPANGHIVRHLGDFDKPVTACETYEALT